MSIIPVKWSFKLQPMLRILQIVGFCDDVDCQYILFSQLVSWMEQAEKQFRAQFLSDIPNITSDAKLTISCELIFQNEEDVNDFLGYISTLYDSL